MHERPSLRGLSAKHLCLVNYHMSGITICLALETKPTTSPKPRVDKIPLLSLRPGVIEQKRSVDQSGKRLGKGGRAAPHGCAPCNIDELHEPDLPCLPCQTAKLSMIIAFPDQSRGMAWAIDTHLRDGANHPVAHEMQAASRRPRPHSKERARARQRIPDLLVCPVSNTLAHAGETRVAGLRPLLWSAPPEIARLAWGDAVG